VLLVAAGAGNACTAFDSAPDAPIEQPDSSASVGPGGATDGSIAEAGPSGDAGGNGDAATCEPTYSTAGLLMLLAGASDACPPESTSFTLKADPVAKAGACSCGACTPLTNPSCGSAVALKVVSFGETNACSDGTDSFSVQDGTCTSAGATVNFSPFNKWPTQTPSAGTCSATKVTDSTNVTATTVRACQPLTASAVCAAIASGKRLCVPREADAGACAAPFTVALNAGDDVALTCAACSCSRTSAKCVVEYHGNSTCTGTPKATVDLAGACLATGSPQAVTHFKMHATTPTCVTTPGAATVSLTSPRALCCTP
jgi:hypothetical protein